MARRENVSTTVVIRRKGVPKKLLLRRDWLHGLLAWAVFDGSTKLGWVLNQMEHPTQWAYVLLPKTEEDIYDDILYDFTSRADALLGLLGNFDTGK